MSLSHSRLLLLSNIEGVSCEVRMGVSRLCSGRQEWWGPGGCTLWVEMEIQGSFPVWVKQLSDSSWMVLRDTPCLFRAQELWRQEWNFLGRLSPFEVREVTMLRGEREVKGFCVSWRRQWGEVAALSEWTPWQHLCPVFAKLIKLSIRSGGEGEKPFCTEDRWDQVIWERDEEVHTGLLFQGESVLDMRSFANNFRSLAGFGWLLPKKSHCSCSTAESQWDTETRCLRCWRQRCSTTTGMLLLLGEVPNHVPQAEKCLEGSSSWSVEIKGQPQQLLVAMKTIWKLCWTLKIAVAKCEAMFTSTRVAVCELKSLVKYSIALFS